MDLYYQVITQSPKSRIKLTDIMVFPWEDEGEIPEVEKGKTIMSQEKIDSILKKHGLKPKE